MERGILFSAPMVKALLAGTKTQTRRIVKPQPEFKNVQGIFDSWTFAKRGGGAWLYPNAEEQVLSTCPYGKPGDLLWVRETWSDASGTAPRQQCALHRATYRGHSGIVWRPSLFMPKWATRIWLEITNVNVERVNEISEEDAKAEGTRPIPFGLADGEILSYRAGFHELWDGLNKKRGYAFNDGPWCWVVSFKRVEKPAEKAA